jgi:hypothetical protein
MWSEDWYDDQTLQAGSSDATSQLHSHRHLVPNCLLFVSTSSRLTKQIMVGVRFNAVLQFCIAASWHVVIKPIDL